jgi:hypothetical protein
LQSGHFWHKNIPCPGFAWLTITCSWLDDWIINSFFYKHS